MLDPKADDAAGDGAQLKTAFQGLAISSEDVANEAFVYDAPQKYLFRLFQLDIPDDGEKIVDDTPLCGKLLSFTFDQGTDEYFQTFTAAISEGRTSTLKALSGSEKYIAVSYSWGKGGDRRPLHLEKVSCTVENGLATFEVERSGYIGITPNAQSFLLEMRRQRERRLMWIDTICIDQSCDEDRAYQIPRMNELYEHAECVYVWLGEASTSETMALRMMANMTEKLRSCEAVVEQSLETVFGEAGLPEPGHDVWRAFASILTRDWWSRLWTFQEVTMATAPKQTVEYQGHYKAPYAFVWCGETRLAWEQFDFFAEALADKGLRSWLITGREGAAWNHLHGLDAIEEVRTGRESLLRYGWACSLSALLVATRRRQATKAADMVWGMYALIDKPARRALALKQDMLAEEVFIRFAKHYIRNEVKECLLNHVATLDKLPGLPSWCPNFASDEETTSIGTRWYGHYQERPWLKKQMPCAGFQKKGRWALPRSKAYYAKYLNNALRGKHALSGLYATNNPRQIALVSNSDAILASGIHLDTIAEVVPYNAAAEAVSFLSYNSVQQTAAWDRACFSVAQRWLRDSSQSTTSQSKYDLYARTLTANRVAASFRESRQRESTWSEAFQSGWNSDSEDELSTEVVFDREGKVDFAASYLSLRGFMQATMDVGETIPSRVNLGPAARRFAECLQLMTRRRCFFATKAGRIGLGPSDARPGDKVVVIFYCPTPYLIRPAAGDGAAGQWRMIGEAFVHGFMYGEALNMFDDGKLHETKWTIC